MQSVPAGIPSCSPGPATPVSASPTSAPSTRRAPCAISSAAVSLTTGPSLTPSNCCLTSLAYDTIDPRNTELEPGTLDVLISGDAHTLLHHRIGDTFVLEQRAHGHAIGLLDLVVTRDGVDADASRLKAPWFLSHTPVDPG